MLADSFARLAQSKAETKDFAAAYAFVKKGLEIDSKNALLDSLKNEYQSEANIIELTKLFKTAFAGNKPAALFARPAATFSSVVRSALMRSANVFADALLNSA